MRPGSCRRSARSQQRRRRSRDRQRGNAKLLAGARVGSCGLGSARCGRGLSRATCPRQGRLAARRRARRGDSVGDRRACLGVERSGVAGSARRLRPSYSDTPDKIPISHESHPPILGADTRLQGGGARACRCWWLEVERFGDAEFGGAGLVEAAESEHAFPGSKQRVVAKCGGHGAVSCAGCDDNERDGCRRGVG